jgi:hypothetical protein
MLETIVQFVNKTTLWLFQPQISMNMVIMCL